MNKLYLSFIFLFATIFSYGQTLNFGVKAGANYSTLFFSDQNSAGNGEYIPGLNAGVIADIGFNNILIQPGLLYSGKGQKVSLVLVNSNQQPAGTATNIQRLNYLELPVNVLYIIKEIKFAKAYAGGGGYVAYGASQSASIEGKTYTTSLGKNPDYGLSALIGLEFKNRMLVNAGYEFGLASLSDGNTLQNRVISVSVGYMLK